MEAEGAPPVSPKPPQKGVIYLSNIPPYMGVHKLRNYMLQFGPVGRIYLKPEDATHYKNRLKHKGCKKVKFTEGWVEFHNKSIAKRVALALNGQTIGGKKRHNFWRDDIWTIKYLKNFEWVELAEERIYKRNVRSEKLRVQAQQTQRENAFYLNQVERRNRRLKREKKKEKDEIKEGVDEYIDTKQVENKIPVEDHEQTLLDALAL